MKKAQGLPMNIIIIAAIALIVLVVLVFIFVGKTKMFTTSASSCTEKRGQCSTAQACEGSIIGQMDCLDGQICCITLTEAG